MKIVSVDEIKEEVQLLDPNLDEDDDGFQVAVVLMSAAFVTGPNTEGLVALRLNGKKNGTSSTGGNGNSG